MARRKKEPLSVHRERIAAAANDLFTEKGVEAASMDDIAERSGYSKATLYVYFKNKEEIVGLLTLKSIEKLYGCLSSALEQQETTKARYDSICRELVKYQKEYPFYFETSLDKINIEEKETYRVGEKINEKMTEFVLSGIKNGDFRGDLEIMSTIFGFWGMMSGLIKLADSKEDYIKTAMGLTKDEFLEHGFNMLYRSVAKNEDNEKSLGN